MSDKKFKSYNLNKCDIEIDTSFMKCRVFWARIVSHENESLFTQYTKHTFYEIQYALEGHIGMLTDRGNLYVAESDFAVIPPDTFHQVIDADSFGARFIMAFSREMKDPKLLKALNGRESLKPHKETPYMRGLLNMILDKNSESGAFKKKSLSSLVESFMLEIMEAILSGEARENPPIDVALGGKDRVGEMLSYIKNCGGVGLRVAEIAQKFNMSERHLGRLFMNELGQTPSEVINREKLKKIEEYIISTNLSFGEISELCGFCDEYAMNKFFKKQTKTTLSDFKKLSGKGK